MNAPTVRPARVAPTPHDHACWVVLWNEHAGTVQTGRPVLNWARVHDHELVRTEGPEHAEETARRAAERGCTVVAAGGDGTLHCVVKGLLTADAPCPRLGIVPLGTGNDFVRSLKYPQDVLEVLALLDRGATRPVDAIEVSTPEGEHVCLNVASAGAAGALAEEIDAESKQRWGPLAYVWNGVARALGAEPFVVELRLEGSLAFQGQALNLVVANGAFAGGGYKVAPEAQVDDGLLEVHLIRPCGTLRRCDLVARLAAGTLEASDVVESFRARRIELRTSSEQPLNLDGEPAGRAQAFAFKARSAALRVIVP